MKRVLSVVLAGLLAATAFSMGGLQGITAEAKTISSAKGEVIFLYAEDQNGKAVLVDQMALDDLKEVSHGQPDGEEGEDGSNYYYSSTDNYPTTQYCEAKGLTIEELLQYAEEHSETAEDGSLHFGAGDSIAFMATDSYGNYTRTWNYEDLFVPDRYYFEGLYDKEHGWRTAWEIAGTDNSKFGISLEQYNAEYKDKDSYYENKRAVFSSGVPMPVILATESFSGRTTTETLVASTEPGIAAQIADNGGVVTGCLKDMISDETALRLCIPMTEADLMAAHRTSYDNFKWVYNLKLKQKESRFLSQGTVAEPTASVAQNDDILTITLDCETPGASVYYSFDGAPQQLYTEPFTYDTKGADLTANPVTIYLTAVREGFDDAGVVSVKYPQPGIVFKTQYSAVTGQDLVFEAENSVSAEDWNAWTENLLGISVKKPSGASYETLEQSLWTVDNKAKTIAFSSSVTVEPGAYSFLIYAKGYANKRLSISLKNLAPALTDLTVPFGEAVTIPFANMEYQKNVYLYITPENGSKQLISAGYTDRSVSGQVTIKKEWFALDSCPVKEPGVCELEVMNNSYTPVSQTIRLTLTEPSVPVHFDDVKDTDWFAPSVQWAVENNVFNGVSEREFAPGMSMTRAMFATVLWRMNGSPDPNNNPEDTDGGKKDSVQPDEAIETLEIYMQTKDAALSENVAGTSTEPVKFTDVVEDSWYADAVAWCSAKGYVNGYGGGLFGVSDPITREQMATILFRYTSSKEDVKDLAAVRGDLSRFADRSSVSDWADEAMCWAVGIRMINGVSADRLDPQGLATRAQTATMLMNYTKTQAEYSDDKADTAS